MHNPSGLLGPVPSGPAGRFVRVKKGVAGFLQDGRFVTPGDAPFAVSDHRAAELLKQGLVEACAPVAAIAGSEVMKAVNPAPAKAERAIAKPARA